MQFTKCNPSCAAGSIQVMNVVNYLVYCGLGGNMVPTRWNRSQHFQGPIGIARGYTDCVSEVSLLRFGWSAQLQSVRFGHMLNKPDLDESVTKRLCICIQLMWGKASRVISCAAQSSANLALSPVPSVPCYGVTIHTFVDNSVVIIWVAITSPTVYGVSRQIE